MKKIYPLSLILIVLFSITACRTVQSNNAVAEPLKSDLKKSLDSLVQHHQLPGITLGLVLPDGASIQLGSGLADKETGTPMPPNGRMYAGSVGKMFVSAVALKLLEQQLFSLEDKISKYLGDRAWFASLPNGADITIKDLMQHTTGIPRYIGQPEFLADIKQNPHKERSPEDCIAYVLNKTPLHPTGKGWGYSDTNYLILGLIMEQESKRTYYDMLQEWILKPLKLSNTTPIKVDSFEGMVQGYIDNPLFGLPDKMIQNGQLVMNPEFEWTGGGVLSNTLDLAIWAKQLHEGKVVGSSVYQQLIQAVDQRTGQVSNSGYGLGTFVWNKPTGIRYGHAGFFPGYLTQVEYSKNHKYALAIQLNTDGSYPLMAGMLSEFDAIIEQYLGK